MAIMPASIRPLGTTVVSRASLPGQLRQKNSDNNQNQIRRVRDIKSAEQLDKKKRKIQRIFATQQKQGNLPNFARQMNAYILRAIYDWDYFSDSLTDLSSLDDATRLFFNTAHLHSFLFPHRVLDSIRKYLNKYGVDSGDLLEVDAELIQLILSKDNLVSNLMTQLAVCRSYEKDQVRLMKRQKNKD